MNLIYYFTGTGNSLAVAKQVADQLGDTKLVRMTNANKEINEHEKVDRIGFVYPVYFGAVPKLVTRYIKQVNIPNAKYVFSIATCGGMAAGANGQLKKVLNKKGLDLKAGFSVSMAANNQTSYVPVRDSERMTYAKRAEKDVKSILARIERRESYSVTSGLASSLGPKLASVVIPPSSDKHFLADEKCIACGICQSVCPAGNISMNDGKPSWNGNCSRCTACMQLCPKEAIQFGEKSKSWGRYSHPLVSIEELMIIS